MAPLLMTRTQRYLLYTSITLGILLFLTALFLILKPAQQWQVPAKELGVAEDLQLVRGKYLVENIAHCAHCHSETDSNKFGFPVLPNTKYAGAFLLGHKQGVPAELYGSNITPYKLAEYTDSELYRSLTQGYAKDGHVMFPIMPYLAYGKMDPQDIWAMIAYLRKLPSIKKDVPKSEIDFPVNILVKLGQQEPKPTFLYNLKKPEELGSYYANIAGCIDCHSPENEKHEPDLTKAGAGGREFLMPGGMLVRSSNITPHALGNWTEARFVARFKQYADSAYQPPVVKPGELNTYMAWHSFSGMTETDIKSIYSFLKTLPSNPNEVVKFEKAPMKQ
jgi:mono/diheme cytochrome c family protein